MHRYKVICAGSPVSVTNIVKCMTSKGEKISDETVANYLKYLRDSFLAKPIKRFDIHGKMFRRHISSRPRTPSGESSAILLL